ncbi:MAG: hypothetical protein LBT88_06685 [Oscillospiraceae bacterium]|jgi:hypothetical protein|nr:hypothetical protein [Oscillospiraceae bacterium]
MKPIRYLLADINSEYVFTSDYDRVKSKNKKEKLFYIRPCIEDRMFVCCLVSDQEFVPSIANGESLPSDDRYTIGEYKYIKENYSPKVAFSQTIPHRASDILYKLLFIDLDDPSSQSRISRRKILENAVYDRWIDYGTIHAVTHHSFFCVTGSHEDVRKSVINPFLTEYIEMAIISLAQRSTILSLSAEAAKFVEGIEDNKTNKENLGKIEDLQKKYAQAQSQILIFDVTPQEQGVELFDMLTEQLYIKENRQYLDALMTTLRDVANISHERITRNADNILNRRLALVSVIGVMLTLLQVLPTFIKFSILKIFNSNESCIFIKSCILIIVIIIVIYKILKNK